MGDPSKSQQQTQNFHYTLGIPKTATITDICKAYKSLVKKWHPDRNPNNKAEAEAKFNSIHEAYRALSIKKREEEINTCIIDLEAKTPKKKKDFQISSPTLLSRTTSRTSAIPRGPSSRSSSQRSTTPIHFSQSAIRRKPQPVEKKLKCSLEELCHGCVKKIKITRAAISNTGLIVQEEETLTIKVKPGWKKGTKITFEEKGDERPGSLPADIIFEIDEKRHPVFKREGDDLELGVRVPLLQALMGCKISVPLLGQGQKMVVIEDIIYPGYEKIVPGQGMPKSKECSRRGDLRLKFLVEFPTELSNEQRSQVVNILGKCP